MHGLCCNSDLALVTFPRGVAEEYLRSASTSSALPSKLWATVCLLQLGGSGHLESLESVLLNPPPDLEITLGSFALAMRGHVKSPESVATLGELLRSSDVNIRRASAYDLRDIGTAKVIAPLSTIALYDPDREVRYLAVSGLERLPAATFRLCRGLNNRKTAT